MRFEAKQEFLRRCARRTSTRKLDVGAEKLARCDFVFLRAKRVRKQGVLLWCVGLTKKTPCLAAKGVVGGNTSRIGALWGKRAHAMSYLFAEWAPIFPEIDFTD